MNETLREKACRLETQLAIAKRTLQQIAQGVMDCREHAKDALLIVDGPHSLT